MRMNNASSLCNGQLLLSPVLEEPKRKHRGCSKRKNITSQKQQQQHPLLQTPFVFEGSIEDDIGISDRSTINTGFSTTHKDFYQPTPPEESWAYASCQGLFYDKDADLDKDEEDVLLNPSSSGRRRVAFGRNPANVYLIEARNELTKDDIWYTKAEMYEMREEAITIQTMLDRDPTCLDYEESDHFSSRGIDQSSMEARRKDLRAILMVEITYYMRERVMSTTTAPVNYFDSTVPQFLVELTEWTSKEAANRATHDLSEALFIYKESRC